MSAIVAEALGGYEVSHVVANALARARGRAATRGDAAPDLTDVAAAVLSAPGSYVSAVLTAVDISPADLVNALAGSARGDRRPAVFDEQLAAVLARADRERGRAGDDAVGSVHLMSALTQSPDAGLAPLRDAGIDAGLLRAAAARAQVEAEADDGAFRPPPAPTVLDAPVTPLLDDLATRTPMRRSATLTQLLNSQMPSGPNATSSPYGQARARRWVVVQVLHQLLAIAVLVLAVDRGVHWWLYPLLWGTWVSPTTLPAPIQGVLVAAVVVFAPLPVAVTAVMAAVAGGVEGWYELWMKRVDRSDPGMTMRQLRTDIRSTGIRVFQRRMGIADEE